MPGNSFLTELRRRKVPQAAAIYGAVAWGVTEVVVTVVEQLFLPQWVATIAVIGFVVGFPVAMFLAWTFDITSGGIRRTSVTSRRGKASIAASLLLLVAGTAGLFLLIRPALVSQQDRGRMAEILPNSLAVMPFESAGQDAQDRWLIEGLSDELRDQLGQMAGLRIAARSSSIAAREQRLDARAISDKLGVANLVEGSMRRQGNRMRISVQLIEGNTGLALWSETFERGPNELLNVQMAIAEQVVRTVLPENSGELAEPATRDVNANELMLLARHYEQQVRDRQVVDVPTLREAARLYREASKADPDSALAHSRLASALIYLGDLDEAEAPIFKALSLGPNLSEVQNTLGEFYWARGLPEARTAFARAVELNPNNADALHNHAYSLFMNYEADQFLDEVEQLWRRALDLDRLSLARHAALGQFLGKEGWVDQLPPVIREIEELFDNAESYRLIALLKEYTGDLDQSIAWTLRARDLEPGQPDHVRKLADLYAAIGDFETTLELEPQPGLWLLFRMRRYQELIDSAEYLMIEDPSDINIRYLLAFAYNATGQFESALHVLSTTGLPDSVLQGGGRSVTELEAFVTLMNALAGIGTEETMELARSLADYYEGGPWHGDMAWVAPYKSCSLILLDRREDALQMLPRAKESEQLILEPFLRDSWCFLQIGGDPVYLDLLEDQEQRRARLREKLPATLAQSGVGL